MERREFVQRIGGLLALALAPGVADASTVGGPDLRSLAEADPPAVVEGLRTQVGRLRDTAEFPKIEAWVASRGHEPALVGHLLATMWLSATFRDLPAEARRSAEVQRYVVGEAPAMSASLFEVVELVEGLDPTERAELARVVSDEPELMAAFGEGIRAHGRRRGVDPARLDQVGKLTDHAAWRIRHQSPDALLDELVDRFDRHCRRHGISRREWRAGLAAEAAGWRALEVIADPDAHAAAALDEPELVAVDERGAHLGVAFEARGDAPRIARVTPGSPAARAGLRAGDRLEDVDGRAFGAAALVGWLGTRAPDREVALGVRRGGERVELRARLGAGPGDRLVVDRGLRRERAFPFTEAGLLAGGIGTTTMLVGGGMFLVGVILAAVGGGSAVTVFGGALTVLGILVVIVGVLIFFVERIAAATKSARNRRMDPPAP